MKRLALILLIGVYSLSTFGVNIKQFYCCGKLKSVSIIASANPDRPFKKDTNDGCCKTKYKSFKVKDCHLGSSDIVSPVNHYTDLVSFDYPFQKFISPSQKVDVINGCHAPPLHPGVPVYISACVFKV
ncbi:MAG: hypothetical protein ABJA57_09405 [Ginsengibacter sp.]